MRSFAIISALLATTLAAPAPPLQHRQTPSHLPTITEVTYRVSNLEDPTAIKFVDTKLLVNGGAANFDTSNDLVGAGPGRLNTEGFVSATRVDITSSLQGILCNLYNQDKHLIAVLSSQNMGVDFDGWEEVESKAINADKYSLLCYYG